MDELMQRDEDALVQQRLHADRLRRGSTPDRAEMNEGIQTSKWSDQACRQGVAEMHTKSEAHKHKSPREQEQKRQGVAVVRPEPKG